MSTILLGISGSVRAGSNNTVLLHTAAALAGSQTRLELWQGLAAIPPFNEDDEAQPAEAVHALRAAITRADALLKPPSDRRSPRQRDAVSACRQSGVSRCKAAGNRLAAPSKHPS